MSRTLLLTSLTAILGATACGGSSEDDTTCYGFEGDTTVESVVDAHRLVRIKADPTLASVFPPPPGETMRYYFYGDSQNNYVDLVHAPKASPDPPYEERNRVGTLVWPLAESHSEGPRSVTARLYTCAPGESPWILGEGRPNECTNLETSVTREADSVAVPGTAELEGTNGERLVAKSEILDLDLSIRWVEVPNPNAGRCIDWIE